MIARSFEDSVGLKKFTEANMISSTSFIPVHFTKTLINVFQYILSINQRKRITGSERKSTNFPRGLRNLGNTCFLNSILQAFISFEQLELYLKRSLSKTPCSFGRKLLKCLQEIRPSVPTMFAHSPVEILREIILCDRRYSGQDQQDAQELFQTISVKLQDDFKWINQSESGLKYYSNGLESNSKQFKSSTAISSSESSATEEFVLSTKESISQSVKLLGDIQPISTDINPFEGLLASQVICQRCLHSRPVQHETFFSVSLPIPTNAKQDLLTSSTFLKSSSGQTTSVGSAIFKIATNSLASDLTLYDCLNTFTSGEYIDEVECPLCTTIAAVKTEKEKIANSPTNGNMTERKALLNHLNYLEDLARKGDRDRCHFSLEEEFQNGISSICTTTSNSDGKHFSKSDQSVTSFVTSGTSKDKDDDNSSLADKDIVPAFTKVRTKILKKHLFSRFPEILCIHLVRRVFSKVTGDMMKISRLVKFPLDLDMSPYFYYKRPVDIQNLESNTSSAYFHDQKSTSNTLNNQREKIRYFLRAVIVHHGSADAGHYTTYRIMEESSTAKQEKNRVWMHFSDDKFIKVDEREVLGCQAYMLFYERIKS